MKTFSEKQRRLVSYAVMHALTDGICVSKMLTTIVDGSDSPQTQFLLFVLYNVLAFCLQPFTGLLCDRMRNNTHSLVRLSVLLTVFGFLLPVPLWMTVTLLGLGNALFHTAAGTAVMHFCDFGGTDLGIFVSPGALGLMLGKCFPILGYLFVIVLLFFAVLPYKELPLPKATAVQPESSPASLLFILAILLAVLARAMEGAALQFSWSTVLLPPFVLLSLAAVLGKALGGFLYDRFGGITCIVSLSVSAVCAMFFQNVAVLSILGTFCLNLSMPVTLLFLYRLMPKRPGFAFGLAASVLYPGMMLGEALPAALLPYLLPAVFILNLLFIVLTEQFLKISVIKHNNI